MAVMFGNAQGAPGPEEQSGEAGQMAPAAVDPLNETAAASAETEQSAAPEPEAAAAPMEEPAPAPAVTDRTDEVLAAVSYLRELFENKIETDAHKNQLFDNMHRQLVKYENGAIEKVVDNMAMDVILLSDNVKKILTRFTGIEASQDNYVRLLKQVRGISEELEDILYRENIEAFTCEGDDPDVKKQKIIGSVPTEDEALNNKIAARGSCGYDKGDKVFRKEQVKIYKYTPAVDNTESK